MLRGGLRCHAGACAPAHQRAGAERTLGGPPNVETEHVAPAPGSRSAALLAGSVLRFSGMERKETN